MPDTQPERNEKGHFIIGKKGGPGRPIGSRNKLAGELIDALYTEFCQSGPEVIKKVATTDPTSFLRIVTGLLPREVVVAALHVSTKTTLEELTEAGDFATAYKLARNMIGAEPALIEVESERLDCEFAHDDD
jgi:hypothetical protein